MTKRVDEPAGDPGRTVFVLYHEYTATVDGWEAVDFPRLLGVFSTRQAAEETASYASTLPGFDGELGSVDNVAGLIIDEVSLDVADWDTGFVTEEPSEDVRR